MVTDTVGNTPLVELRCVVPEGSARVLVKVEGQNPTGSMKDRMAVSVVDRAIADGRLQPGGRLVEYTGGSTGTSLAFACAARGYPITVVTSDAFSREKRDHMLALGADVIELRSDNGRTTKELIERMIARAADLAEEPGAFFADQFRNPDAAAGYAPLAEEILRDSDRIDAFYGVSKAISIIPGPRGRTGPRHGKHGSLPSLMKYRLINFNINTKNSFIK